MLELGIEKVKGGRKDPQTGKDIFKLKKDGIIFNNHKKYKTSRDYICKEKGCNAKIKMITENHPELSKRLLCRMINKKHLCEKGLQNTSDQNRSIDSMEEDGESDQNNSSGVNNNNYGHIRDIGYPTQHRFSPLSFEGLQHSNPWELPLYSNSLEIVDEFDVPYLNITKENSILIEFMRKILGKDCEKEELFVLEFMHVKKLPEELEVFKERRDSNGRNLLIHFAVHGWEVMCKIAIENCGYDPNFVDGFGCSCLHYAARFTESDHELYDFLKKSGGNLKLKNKFEKTPEDELSFRRISIKIVEVKNNNGRRDEAMVAKIANRKVLRELSFPFAQKFNVNEKTILQQSQCVFSSKLYDQYEFRTEDHRICSVFVVPLKTRDEEKKFLKTFHEEKKQEGIFLDVLCVSVLENFKKDNDTVGILVIDSGDVLSFVNIVGNSIEISTELGNSLIMDLFDLIGKDGLQLDMVDTETHYSGDDMSPSFSTTEIVEKCVINPFNLFLCGKNLKYLPIVSGTNFFYNELEERILSCYDVESYFEVQWALIAIYILFGKDEYKEIYKELPPDLVKHYNENIKKKNESILEKKFREVILHSARGVFFHYGDYDHEGRTLGVQQQLLFEKRAIYREKERVTKRLERIESIQRDILETPENEFLFSVVSDMEVNEYLRIEKKLFEKSKDLYRNGGNIFLRCEEKEINCHKEILMWGCEFFFHQFNDRWSESKEKRVSVEEISFRTLEAVVRFAYYGTFVDNLESFVQLELIIFAAKYIDEEMLGYLLKKVEIESVINDIGKLDEKVCEFGQMVKSKPREDIMWSFFYPKHGFKMLLVEDEIDYDDGEDEEEKDTFTSFLEMIKVVN